MQNNRNQILLNCYLNLYYLNVNNILILVFKISINHKKTNKKPLAVARMLTWLTQKIQSELQAEVWFCRGGWRCVVYAWERGRGAQTCWAPRPSSTMADNTHVPGIKGPGLVPQGVRHTVP